MSTWERADVILVAVGYEDAPDLIHVLLQIRYVRNDKIDSEHLFLREHEPAVDDDHIFAVLDHEHVLPYLADPAERDDRYLLSCVMSHFALSHLPGIHSAMTAKKGLRNSRLLRWTASAYSRRCD